MSLLNILESSMIADNAIVVEFRNISKRFPGVVALNGVNVKIRAGTCHGLVGENGAGKSTLGKILAGIYRPDNGTIFVEGREVVFQEPAQAMKAGIGIVHQELTFCENMTVAENLCLEHLPRRGVFFSRRQMLEQAKRLLEPIGASIDVTQPMAALSVGRQQLVQIAAAIGKGARVLIFDEPTSSLSEHESRQLFKLIKGLQLNGITSIYVSHRMEEIFELCDEITVLRDGQLVSTVQTTCINRDELVQMMIGRSIEAYFPKHVGKHSGNEILRVESLSSPGRFEKVNFSVNAGEIVGMAGLVGAGRTEIAQAIFGLDPYSSGRIYIQGSQVSITGPIDAMKSGIGLIPEDRKHHGLVLSMTAAENISLGNLGMLSRLGWIHRDAELDLARHYFELLDVNAAGTDATALSLSGGNQQKLVLARWLAAKSRVLLIDEPTRGVDVGAKAQIHGLIDELACKGTAILLISSEMPELLSLSTRVLVVQGGHITGELGREEMNQERVLRLMAGIQN
jgi:ABC-type sugar transport system ATPase subunit